MFPARLLQAPSEKWAPRLRILSTASGSPGASVDGSISRLSSWACEPAPSGEKAWGAVSEDSGAHFLLLHFTLSAGAELAEPCGVGGGSEGLDL